MENKEPFQTNKLTLSTNDLKKPPLFLLQVQLGHRLYDGLQDQDDDVFSYQGPRWLCHRSGPGINHQSEKNLEPCLLNIPLPSPQNKLVNVASEKTL